MGKTRKIKLGDIVLPVTPVELEVITPQLNKRLTLLNMGTVNLKGNRDVATATISSFFPSQESPFYAVLSSSSMIFFAVRSLISSISSSLLTWTSSAIFWIWIVMVFPPDGG